MTGAQHPQSFLVQAKSSVHQEHCPTGKSTVTNGAEVNSFQKNSLSPEDPCVCLFYPAHSHVCRALWTVHFAEHRNLERPLGSSACKQLTLQVKHRLLQAVSTLHTGIQNKPVPTVSGGRRQVAHISVEGTTQSVEQQILVVPLQSQARECCGSGRRARRSSRLSR